MLNPISAEQLVDVGAEKKKKGIAGIDQGELVDPKLLADLDSCFCEFNGVHIHHKICDAESQTQSMFQSQTVSHQIKKLGYPMILLHGFGASVFSWKQVMKPLAQVAGSKVLAFDRPAFGLTSRVNLSKHRSSETEDTKPLNAYSMAFSVLATLHFIKLLNAEKVILMGYVNILSSVLLTGFLFLRHQAVFSNESKAYFHSIYNMTDKGVIIGCISMYGYASDYLAFVKIAALI